MQFNQIREETDCNCVDLDSRFDHFRTTVAFIERFVEWLVTHSMIVGPQEPAVRVEKKDGSRRVYLMSVSFARV